LPANLHHAAVFNQHGHRPLAAGKGFHARQRISDV
jgi:hypothetical protein